MHFHSRPEEILVDMDTSKDFTVYSDSGSPPNHTLKYSWYMYI